MWSISAVYPQNKLFELLFNLSEINPNLIYSFIQFTTYKSIDIHKVMDSSFRENLTLEEFAYKAGRSLATFKRDSRKPIILLRISGYSTGGWNMPGI